MSPPGCLAILYIIPTEMAEAEESYWLSGYIKRHQHKDGRGGGDLLAVWLQYMSSR